MLCSVILWQLNAFTYPASVWDLMSLPVRILQLSVIHQSVQFRQSHHHQLRQRFRAHCRQKAQFASFH